MLPDFPEEIGVLYLLAEDKAGFKSSLVSQSLLTVGITKIIHYQCFFFPLQIISLPLIFLFFFFDCLFIKHFRSITIYKKARDLPINNKKNKRKKGGVTMQYYEITLAG